MLSHRGVVVAMGHCLTEEPDSAYRVFVREDGPDFSNSRDSEQKGDRREKGED